MNTASWLGLAHEYKLILRPGGILCLTQWDKLGMTNSVALGTYNELLTTALHRSVLSFSSHVHRVSVTPKLGRLLYDVGFQAIEQKRSVFDYSF